MKIDATDERILGILQEDASLTVQEVADRAGLSSTPCWRRIRQLETTGVIERRVAIVNAASVGLAGTAYVFVRTNRHEAAWLETFASAIEEIPEIVECHRLSGDVDYLLKCVVKDIEHYDRVYRRLITRVEGLIDVSSAFSMERLKQVTKLDVATARN